MPISEMRSHRAFVWALRQKGESTQIGLVESPGIWQRAGIKAASTCVSRTEGLSVSWTARDMAAATWNLQRKTVRTMRCLADGICHSVGTTVEQNPSTALRLDLPSLRITKPDCWQRVFPAPEWGSDSRSVAGKSMGQCSHVTYLHSVTAAWRKGDCWVLFGVFWR